MKRPNTASDVKKQKVPTIIWVLIIVGSIFGLLLTRHCQKQLDRYLEVKNIELEQKAPAFAQVSFEIENKARFSIKRKVVVRMYTGNLELGSKMIMSRLEPGQTAGYYVT